MKRQLVEITRKSPTHYVLKDASGTLHEAEGAEELLRAVNGVFDAEQPELEVDGVPPKAPRFRRPSDEEIGKAAGELCDQLGHEVGAEYGPVTGRLAASATRGLGRLFINGARKFGRK